MSSLAPFESPEEKVAYTEYLASVLVYAEKAFPTTLQVVFDKVASPLFHWREARNRVAPEPATPAQVHLLDRMLAEANIDPVSLLSKQEASALIDRLKIRQARRLAPATPPPPGTTTHAKPADVEAQAAENSKKATQLPPHPGPFKDANTLRCTTCGGPYDLMHGNWNRLRLGCHTKAPQPSPGARAGGP